MSEDRVKENVEQVRYEAQEHIESLRAQVEQVLKDIVTPNLLKAADKTDVAVANARKFKDYEIENVSTRVRAQPIAAILISAAIGFVAGRFSR
ncbi:hypothetical protein [Neokomagataea thailandica]|uniref:DUF883 domain-containing protein n=1 Tax=Neokomagataea tanensis NBRC 106556 TaxID=1223519 RepID=A0ABQ0QI08_9PROT|nr:MULTISPECIES: hypothetical protein [Neokomagataea]GBR45487.1 hypothetical protein AA106556_0784 [Neokomagataea tanensis NBRC 106556]